MASNGDETLNLTVKDQVCSVSGQYSRWMLRAPRAAPSLWQDAMLCLHQGPALKCVLLPRMCVRALTSSIYLQTGGEVKFKVSSDLRQIQRTLQGP